ncbi:diguanylate cyclase/phosphodiesterase with PAS/PAC sensor(s) [Sideroxydans lithotrophicus ES-1]|uniref:Diguanylate cyclase/phosphodiesterase with PAS/PAC sensor(S) n=2 Tax=Sideroxydans TaxID=314343 RepID=D5CS79_SIDLE|nr:diguanylate cyclase/phosphodiesterase with PAS/PAC sensor(s) [Sideroxydans lithotrophicus ES-1]
MVECGECLGTDERNGVHHYLLPVVLMTLALWVRLTIAPVQAGLQYLTFFPAVALSCILGGYRAGLVAVIIGATCATYIFTPPYYSFSIESFQASLWSNTVFFMDGLIVSFAVEAMHRYRQKYASELKTAEESAAWLRIASVAFESQEGIMITDSKGRILRVNKAFTESTGYSVDEIIGQTPRLLKSNRHDSAFYAAMWESITRSGSWQGEVWDRRKNGEIYPKWLSITAIKDADGNVTNYVGTHTDISERKTAEEEIRNLAFYDPLTQLPNRRLLQDRLQHAMSSTERNRKGGALLFLDLDNFKSINDTLGHTAGDNLLQQVAQRLTSCVREDDTVSRIGGDEFVVMLEYLSNEVLEAAAQAETIGEKIIAELNQPYYLGGQELYNTPSIGITLFDDNRNGYEDLFKQADIAMYQAKKSGRNTLRFFDPKMQGSINTRVALERELRKALDSQQFRLHYQIQVDSSGLPFGVEALIRWLHPERGLVPPFEFISLAEETGLICPIGEWVLETACKQLKLWERHELTQDLIMSVNVSAKQFYQSDFVVKVLEAIHRHDVNPSLLKLELTESMLLDKIEDTISTMNALKAVGVRFSLDDFGTGYSSLQYLKRLPLNQLKIDRSFVRDIAVDSSDEAIVSTIIAMAHSLNLDVIAEGVETDEQKQILLNKGCIHYQGYLFGKPVPIEQLEVMLKQDCLC